MKVIRNRVNQFKKDLIYADYQIEYVPDKTDPNQKRLKAVLRDNSPTDRGENKLY